jgi:predicted Na+-dependent transporter
VIFLKRQLPLAITFVMGVAFALQYYIPHPVSEEAITKVSDWMKIISGFALVLGIASVFHVHAVKIRRQAPGWGYSGALFAAIVTTMGVGFWSGGESKADGAQTAFGWLYDYTMVPLQGTMFSILAFFIASAAYRAFRARSPEASVLLVSAVVVMMGRVPLGQFLAPWTWHVTQWLLNVLNSAVRRAILIGVSMGSVGLSLKIILGKERSYLGGGKDQ